MSLMTSQSSQLRLELHELRIHSVSIGSGVEWRLSCFDVPATHDASRH